MPDEGKQETGATPASVATGTPAATPEAEADKPLGPNGVKALESERTARKELERQVQQMQQQYGQQMSALAEAFGVKSDGAKPDDVVTTLQQQVAAMQHQSLVDRIARKHQITDADDVEHLASAKDEQAMDRLAARLAARTPETAPGTPKPDLTQGGSGAPPALNSSALEEALKSKLGIS